MVILNKVETDVLVDKLKKSIADFYVYLADEILPKLADGLKEGLEKEKMIKMPMKVNSDRTIAIASLVREMNNFARGNGINVMSVEKTTTMSVSGQEPETGVPKESNYDKLARILAKRGFTITQSVSRVSATSENSTPVDQ